MNRDLSTKDPAIIGLCGAAGSGKSAAADVLCREYGFAAFAFADSLRDMLFAFLGAQGIDHIWITEPRYKERIIPQLGVSGRHLMQSLGDWGRAIDPDFWVKALARSAGLACTSPPSRFPVHDRIVVTDVRFPNEAEWIRKQGGVLVHLSRDTAATTVRPHVSEQHHATLGADLGLRNDGPTLEGLAGLVRGLCADLNLHPVEYMDLR